MANNLHRFLFPASQSHFWQRSLIHRWLNQNDSLRQKKKVVADALLSKILNNPQEDKQTYINAASRLALVLLTVHTKFLPSLSHTRQGELFFDLQTHDLGSFERILGLESDALARHELRVTPDQRQPKPDVEAILQKMLAHSWSQIGRSGNKKYDTDSLKAKITTDLALLGIDEQYHEHFAITQRRDIEMYPMTSRVYNHGRTPI